MNNLTQEQIARIYAQYIGSKAAVTVTEDGETYTGYITGIQEMAYLELQHIEGRHLAEEPAYHSLADCKLLLRPLLAITNDDAIEVQKLVHNESYTPESEKGIAEGRHFATRTWYGSSGFGIQYVAIHQLIIQRGYAVPLFIAPGHPDNGEDAIALGLAIDSTI